VRRPADASGQVKAKGRGRLARVPIRAIPVPTPFPVGPVNVYLIAADPVTLVDTGPMTAAAFSAIERGMAREGLRVRDVKRIALTHGHQDHFGLARRLVDASGAKLIGARLDRRHFRCERRTKRLLDQMARSGYGIVPRFAVAAGVAAIERFAEPPETWEELDGDETLPGDGWSLSVLSTPGHTPGCLTFILPEAGVAFTGDTVLKEITPNAIVDEDPERPGTPFRSLSRYFETLDLLEGEVAGLTLLTGHGPPVGDFAAHHRYLRALYARRIARIEAALADGPMTARRLVEAIFPRVRTINVFLAWSEVVGFLMYLEDRGRIEKIEGRLLDRYRLEA